MQPRIRPATESDCPAITAITNAEIEHGYAHFATEPDDPAEVALSFRQDRSVYPWFVAESSGRVVGFSRAGRWKTRGAYDWTCETGVYLDPEARGSGLGKCLYRALIDELKSRGFRSIIAGVAVPNPPSERLHESMGMAIIGEFPAAGFKRGHWVSVRYYGMTLGDGSAPVCQPGVRV